MINVLFTFEEWEIHYNDTYDYAINATYASHAGCEGFSHARNISWWIDRPPHCRFCSVAVPDEVQGMLILLMGNTGPDDKRVQ